MKISRLIEQLEKVKSQHGDVEVTMTATLWPEGSTVNDEAFESTVETVRIVDADNGVFKGKRLKLYWHK